MLGDGVGVHALAAGPAPVVVEDGDERFDASPGQLHPVDAGPVVEQLAQPDCVFGVGPDHGVGRAGRHRFAAAGAHGVGEPLAFGQDQDAGHGTILPRHSSGSGRSGTERPSSRPSNAARTTAA